MTLQDLLRLAQSGARGFTTGLLGAPVDIANTMMGGIGGSKPVMGSEWIGDKLQGMGLLAPHAQDLPNEAAEFAGGLLNPGAVAGKVAAGTKGLLGAHIVFHGSPHTFDKFDMGKIGTGEGAQAYGHGLYFADNPAVAMSYRDMAKDSFFIDRPEEAAARLFDELEKQSVIPGKVTVGSTRMAVNKPTFVKGVTSGMSDYNWWNFPASARDAVEKSYQGNLYRVDIPDEAIGRMLDWDKPLSEQPQAVKQIANDLFRSHVEVSAPLASGMVDVKVGGGTIGTFPRDKVEHVVANVADYMPMSGQDLYRYLGMNSGKETATAKLLRQNIPGIRYLDQGSRGGRPPFRGDAAHFAAAESFKSSGYTAEQALAGMRQAYKNAQSGELQAAINEVYDIMPPKTYNTVLFDADLAKILGRE